MTPIAGPNRPSSAIREVRGPGSSQVLDLVASLPQLAIAAPSSSLQGLEPLCPRRSFPWESRQLASGQLSLSLPPPTFSSIPTPPVSPLPHPSPHPTTA